MLHPMYYREKKKKRQIISPVSRHDSLNAKLRQHLLPQQSHDSDVSFLQHHGFNKPSENVRVIQNPHSHYFFLSSHSDNLSYDLGSQEDTIYAPGWEFCL